MSNQDTFVFNGSEVKLTGRKAIKKAESISRRNRETKTIIDEMVEITPVSIEDGSWKKWVKLDDMFIIENKNEP